MADKDQDEFDDKLHKTEINIDKPTDILKVEKVFEKLQQRYNMCEKKIHETAIIAGELGENIIKHGKHGKMTILYHEHKTMTSFIEIISENVGVLPSRAQEKGMTTKHNSLGIGLNVISRFSDILTYEQEGDILRIRSFKYCWDFPARSEVAVLSYPTSMCIQSNGDSYFIHKSESELLCVIDALGHGTEAYKSASAVINFLQDIHYHKLDDLIYEVHNYIKANRLRGVMLSSVRLDYNSNTILFCGLGDVTTKIFLPEGDKILYPFPKEGIVGDIYRTANIQEFPLIKGSIIAMFSDGLSSKLTISSATRTNRLVHQVNDLMNKYGRAHDDRTLLLAKIL